MFGGCQDGVRRGRVLVLLRFVRPDAPEASVRTSVSRTPHDKLFKKIFEQPEHAAAQLRAVLARSLQTSIDWTSLKVESGSYIDAVLADRYSDLLFSAFSGPDRVLLYVLFEHQSTPESRMGLRLLDYMVQIWMRFAQEGENARKPLPLIVPVVLSHVAGGWRHQPRASRTCSRRARPRWAPRCCRTSRTRSTTSPS